MPLRSRLHNIWIRLTTRFGLEETTPSLPVEPAAVSKIVIPITNIDDLLKLQDIKQSGPIAISSATRYTMITIPKGKRWRIIGYHIEKQSGTWQHTQLTLSKDAATPRFTLANYTSTGSDRFALFAEKILVPELWYLQLYVDSYTAPGNAGLYLLVEEEDAF